MNETTPVENSESQPVEQAAAAPQSFLESLPEDLRAEPSLQNFTDNAALAKSYVHQGRLIGADKVALPGKSATPEEMDMFYNKIGRPESADDYEFDVSGLEQADIDVIRNTSHAAGLNPTQAQAVAKLTADRDMAVIQEFEQNAEAARTEGLNELRSEWGPAFKEKMDRVFQAGVALGLPVERDEKNQPYIPFMDNLLLADGRSVGDHPDIIRLFDRLADKIGEDTLSDADAKVNFQTTPAEARAKRETLMQQGTPYWDNQHPEHQRYVQEVLELNEIIHYEG